MFIMVAESPISKFSKNLNLNLEIFAELIPDTGIFFAIRINFFVVDLRAKNAILNMKE